jgi:hypothetical protein
MRRIPAPATAMRAGVSGRHDSSGGASVAEAGEGHGEEEAEVQSEACGEHGWRKAEWSLRERVRWSGRFFFIWEDDVRTDGRSHRIIIVTTTT